MDRTDTLLFEAAKAFEESSSPFNADWLCEHEVTASECVDLSRKIAVACFALAGGDRDLKEDIILVGALAGSDVDSQIATFALSNLRRNRAMKKLQQL